MENHRGCECSPGGLFLLFSVVKIRSNPVATAQHITAAKKPLFGVIFTKSGFFSCSKIKTYCIFSTAAASVGADCFI